MKTLIMITLAVLVAGVASARLGENEGQIAARYGKPKNVKQGTNEWTGFYEFKDYNVAVVFSNKLSVCEFVGPMKSRKLTKEENDRLMRLIGGDGTWTRNSDFSLTTQSWVNNSNRVGAQYTSEPLKPDTLMVLTLDYAAHLNAKRDAAKAAKEKKKVDGF